MIPVIVIAVCGSVSDPPPTWSEDIQPLIASHCVQCHQAGGPAPFPLVTYEDVARRSTFIKHVIDQELMPPWLPSRSGAPLHASRQLPPGTSERITAWIRAGQPRGASDSGPATSPPVPEMRIPDLELTMVAPWVIPAEGGPNRGRRDRDQRTFVLPVNNNRSLRITGVGHRTASPRAVHSTTLAFDGSGHGAALDRRERGPGYDLPGDLLDLPSGAMGGTGVGNRAIHLPPGFHWEVPADADAVVQINYRPTGRPEVLHDSVLLWTEDRADSRPVRGLLSMIWRVELPPGASREISEEWTLPVDVDLVGLTPRANGVVTSLRVTARSPGEASRILLDIPEHDPHWSMPFMLDGPVMLPAGTIVRTTFNLVNNEANPRNPFVPIRPFVAARRTGVMSVILLAAARDPGSDDVLREWHRAMLKTRQRINRSSSTMPTP